MIYEIIPSTKTEEPGADKTALGELISQVENMDLSGYTDESVTALKAVLQEAKAVYLDEDAAQESVDEAYAQLNQALEALQKKTDDKGPDKDQPTDTDKPSDTDKPKDNTDKAAATGDSGNAAGWLFAAVIAGGALMLTAGKGRQKNS